MANEKKYIDVEKAIKEIAEATTIVRATTPAADVVEVVRCKDCKFFKEYKHFGEFPRCPMQEDRSAINKDNGKYWSQYENCFCSYGERKDDYNEN